MRHIKPRFARLAAGVLAAGLIAVAGIAAGATTGPTTGVLLPLYADPDRDGATFTRLIAAHRRHPRVPITVILNPDSGPGSELMPSYAAVIRRLRASGIGVIGYVYTSYGKRARAAVLRDVALWHNRYHITGIFLDEMAYTSAALPYYRGISTDARRTGASDLVGNPGVDTLPAYTATVDALVVREAAGLPTPAMLGGWHALYGRRHFAFIAYGVARLEPRALRRLLPFAAQISVLAETGTPTFCCIPAYFDQLLADLDP